MTLKEKFKAWLAKRIAKFNKSQSAKAERILQYKYYL